MGFGFRLPALSRLFLILINFGLIIPAIGFAQTSFPVTDPQAAHDMVYDGGSSVVKRNYYTTNPSQDWYSGTQQRPWGGFNTNPNLHCKPKSEASVDGVSLDLATEDCVDSKYEAVGAQNRSSIPIVSQGGMRAEIAGTTQAANERSRYSVLPMSLDSITDQLTEPSIGTGKANADAGISHVSQFWQTSEQNFLDQLAHHPAGDYYRAAYFNRMQRLMAGVDRDPLTFSSPTLPETRYQALTASLPGSRDEMIKVAGVSPIFTDINEGNPTNLLDLAKNQALLAESPDSVLTNKHAIAASDVSTQDQRLGLAFGVRLTDLIFNQEELPDLHDPMTAALYTNQIKALGDKKTAWKQLIGDILIKTDVDLTSADGLRRAAFAGAALNADFKKEAPEIGAQYLLREKTKDVYETVMDILFRYCLFTTKNNETNCGPAPGQKPCWDPSHKWLDVIGPARNAWRITDWDQHNSVQSDFFGDIAQPGTSDLKTAKEQAFIRASSAEISLDQGTIEQFFDIYRSFAPKGTEVGIGERQHQVLDCRYLDTDVAASHSTQAITNPAVRDPLGPVFLNMGNFDDTMEAMLSLSAANLLKKKPAKQLVGRVLQYAQAVAQNQLFQMLNDSKNILLTLSGGVYPLVRQPALEMIAAAAHETELGRVQDFNDKSMQAFAEMNHNTAHELQQTASGGDGSAIASVYGSRGAGDVSNLNSGGIGSGRN